MRSAACAVAGACTQTGWRPRPGDPRIWKPGPGPRGVLASARRQGHNRTLGRAAAAPGAAAAAPSLPPTPTLLPGVQAGQTKAKRCAPAAPGAAAAHPVQGPAPCAPGRRPPARSPKQATWRPATGRTPPCGRHQALSHTVSMGWRSGPRERSRRRGVGQRFDPRVAGGGRDYCSRPVSQEPHARPTSTRRLTTGARAGLARRAQPPSAPSAHPKRPTAQKRRRRLTRAARAAPGGTAPPRRPPAPAAPPPAAARPAWPRPAARRPRRRWRGPLGP